MVSHVGNHKTARINSVENLEVCVKDCDLVSYLSVVSLLVVMETASKINYFVLVNCTGMGENGFGEKPVVGCVNFSPFLLECIQVASFVVLEVQLVELVLDSVI